MAEARPPLWGIVLAAGASRRFLEAAADDPDTSYPRTLKQLLPFDGEPLVRRTARMALEAGLAGVIVVGGCRSDEIRSAVDSLDVVFVDNPDYTEGRSSSIRAALEAVPPEADGAIFLQSDQPYLDVETLGRLRVAFEASPTSIVVPVHRERLGSPVTFPRSLFSELRDLEGDRGGRELFEAHARHLVRVELPDERPLEDIDTPASLRRLLG